MRFWRPVRILAGGTGDGSEAAGVCRAALSPVVPAKHRRGAIGALPLDDRRRRARQDDPWRVQAEAGQRLRDTPGVDVRQIEIEDQEIILPSALEPPGHIWIACTRIDQSLVATSVSHQA